MQSNNTKELLFNDGYREKYSSLICDIVNKHLPKEFKMTESQKKEQVLKSLRRANRYATVQRDMKADNDAPKYGKEYKTVPGVAREIHFFKGTKEEIIAQRAAVSTLAGGKQYTYDCLVNTMESDYVSNFTNDEDKILWNYMDNKLKYISAFNMQAKIRSQDLQVNGEMGKAYKNKLGMIESLNIYQTVYEITGNPINIMMPNVPGMNIDIMAEVMAEIQSLDPKQYPDLPECLKPDNVMKSGMSFANKIAVREENRIVTNEFERLKKEKKIDEDFMMTQNFSVDGKEATFKEYMEAVKSGNTNRGIINMSKDEREMMKDSLYNNALTFKDPKKQLEAGDAFEVSPKLAASRICSLMGTLEMYTGKMNKTNSVFSKDSPEYKDMSKSMNKLLKDFKDQKINEDNIKEVNDFYKEHEKELKDLRKNVNSYINAKRLKNETELKAGKKLSERSTKRLELAETIFKLTEGKPQLIDMKEEPYRSGKMKEIIAGDIKKIEKQNEKVMVKEISKSKEKEMEMEGPSTGR